jgi:hypothetical protein
LCCGLAAGGDVAGDDEAGDMFILVFSTVVLTLRFMDGVVDRGRRSTYAAVIGSEDRGLVGHVDSGGVVVDV